MTPKHHNKKYHALHKVGVLHGDVEMRHWYRTPSGDINLIDFDRAMIIGEDPDLSLEEFEEEAESEMESVLEVFRDNKREAEERVGSGLQSHRQTTEAVIIGYHEERARDGIPSAALQVCTSPMISRSLS
ncbi:hypothetical protein L198_00418 [Cryptococcus wingfieldii CBS 7118]|uniref:Protein kinase domain-containing protein n=1 Tax=Cryptococcus wingfieldii CBS 7118 TaxID=1295528 RepID=A0A1E3K6R3_9TREE|nr:hypothetical protein L198_00418 [Cryptococcus wingfieldii CBS 7118]ODO08685.1 hypothetical protein L198_00418 [Cryptococcus wingfieldii CBS 7118]